MKLDLYEANADYIAYLRQFDSNVLTDKTYKQKKYVGTIVTIHSCLLYTSDAADE